MKVPVTLAQHVLAAAARTPQIAALRTAAGDYTYAALASAMRDQARPLAADPAGIRASTGDSRQLALGAYACSAAGRCLWPLDPATAEARWPVWSHLAGGHAKRLAALPATSADRLPATVAPDALALILATSGSAGEPKAVMLSHRNLDAAAAAANERLTLGPGDLWLDCLPLFHIGGLAILWRAARAGATVLLHDGFECNAVAASLASEPVTHISLVPAMLARLLDLGVRPPSSLRVALIGGAALSATLHRRGLAAGWPLHPTWGMSETTAQIATHAPSDGPWQPGLAGRPLSGNRVAAGDDGRLRVAGPQVMLGYLNPSLTPGLGLDGEWLPTGDLGRCDRAGVTILGRADEIMVSAGNKIHPHEVEAVVAACPGVREVAVIGRPDPIWGDLIVAAVVGETDADTIDTWCRERLRPAALPRQVIRLPDLPRLAAGKIDRAAVRRLIRADSP